MRSFDRRQDDFDYGGGGNKATVAPGKQTLSQLQEGASAPSSPGIERGRQATAATHERAGTWEADDALLSAMGLTSELGHREEAGLTPLAAARHGGVGGDRHESSGNSLESVAARPAATGTGRALGSLRSSHPVVYMDLGGRSFSISGGRLMSGVVDLGEIEDASNVVRALSSSPPKQLVFRPNDGVTELTGGDLLSAAPQGSTLALGSKVWILSEGEWSQLAGGGSRGEGKFSSFRKSGGGPVREKLTALTNAGSLRLNGDQIAAMAAIAEVETGGQIGCVQTYDNQVMSVGFKQVVLGHGSLEKLMNAAPAGFAKHGLQLDPSKTYPRRKGWSVAPKQIVGCEDANALRSAEWAIRFYNASIEPDVIAAICDLVLQDLQQVEAAIAGHEGNGRQNYFEDLVAKAWLLEVYNNRPAFMQKVVARTAASAAATRDQFLDILASAVVEVYAEEEPLLAYQKAKATYKAAHKAEMPAEEAADLLAEKKRELEPVGRAKGTNIVTKVPRTLSPASVTGGSESKPATTKSTSSGSSQKNKPSQVVASAVGRAEATSSDRDSATRRHRAEGHEDADTTAGPPPSAATAPTQFRVIAATLNVRSAASTDSRVLGVLHQGDTVDGVPFGEHWLSVRFRGRQGFIHFDHVEPQGSDSSNTLSIGDVMTGIAPAVMTLTNAIGSGIGLLVGGQSSVAGAHARQAPTGARAPADGARLPQEPSAPIPVTSLGDEALERLVTQIANPDVTSIASDLARLKSQSRTLGQHLSRREEQGTGRDQLVEAIGALRTRLQALPNGDSSIAVFKASVNRAVQEISPYYFQSRNIDILEARRRQRLAPAI